MKERVKAALHTPPSEICTQEDNRIVDLGQVPRAIVGLYIKSYSHYKSCLIKIRKGLKPSIPHDVDDRNFDGDNVKYTVPTAKLPFLLGTVVEMLEINFYYLSPTKVSYLF